MITKQEFLAEHNKLSPKNLQATLAILTRFQEEKRPLMKDNSWSVEKIRIPFITWMLAIPPAEEKRLKEKNQEQKFKNYPETKTS